MREMVALLSRPRHVELGIIRNGEADIWMAATLEALVRASIVLQIYQLVRLTARLRETMASRAALALEAGIRWRNFLAVREACETQEDPEPALDTLYASFLWADQPVYSEIHSLLAEGRLDRAKEYLWNVHSSYLHERGDHKFVAGLNRKVTSRLHTEEQHHL